MQPELFIILNSGSGSHDGEGPKALLARVFTEAGRAHRFVEIAPGQIEAVCKRAAAEAREAGGILVAAGGDGTINAVAAAAWKEGCTLGVIPMGTFNYFGRAHGISQEPEQAARALLRAEPAPVQVGMANDRLFLVNGSVGLYPQLLQDREAFKQRFGRHRWVAVLSGLVTIFEWRRQLVLELDEGGQRTTIVTPTLFVGNNRLQLERLGMEEVVLENLGDGELVAVALRPIGSWRMLGLLMLGAFGGLGDADQVHAFAIRKLTVRVRGRRKIKFAADGEVRVVDTPLVFSVGSKPLTLMLPVEADRMPVE